MARLHDSVVQSIHTISSTSLGYHSSSEFCLTKLWGFKVSVKFYFMIFCFVYVQLYRMEKKTYFLAFEKAGLNKYISKHQILFLAIWKISLKGWIYCFFFILFDWFNDWLTHSDEAVRSLGDYYSNFDCFCCRHEGWVQNKNRTC